MTAEQSRHDTGNGLLTPNVSDGRAINQKSKSTSRKGLGKKSPSSSHTVGESPSSMNGSDKSPGGTGEAPSTTAKPKRVRTGCLTCRSRHLKCDEGTPICQNCRKSNRECERGIRLNFIDTTTPKVPIYVIPPTHDWQVTFQDESREIADEYKGGLAKYGPVEKEVQYNVPQEITYDFSQSIGAPTMSHQSLPPMGSMLQTYHEPPTTLYPESMNESYHQHHSHHSSLAASQFSEPAQAAAQSYNSTPTIPADEEQNRPPFETPREVLFMQVFVEEVALWMDSMDGEKHFSELLPFQSLHQPMLRYAFLACGGRHMNLINPAQYPDEVALEYYTKANQLFLRLLQNPDRDTALCATTAVILNVYEVMTEKALQRMNHIAGSRALIKECRWNARSVGVARACFFLNVGLELFSCLHFNWQVAWDPDDWGMDMAMSLQPHGGNEDIWTHKILFILAKVANFRASIPRFREQTAQAEQARLSKRLQTWLDLKNWCDRWHACIPPTMHPMAYVPPFQASMKSSFPEVWLIKRPTIVARMFYHSAMALLGGIHPTVGMDQDYKDSLDQMKIYHSTQICGIVAHVKDRGVASASIRCLAIAAESLANRREQEEVLDIFARIKREGGWRIQFVIDELHEKWGWTNQDADMSNTAGGNTTTASSFYQQSGQASMPPLPQQVPPPAQKKPPSGIVNPLYRNADFSNPDAPYKNFWVPPALPPPAPLPAQQQQQQQHRAGNHGMNVGGNGYGFSGLGGM